MSESGIDGERRRFIAFALTPSLIVLFAIAVLPAIYLVVTSLTPFQLTMPGSATDFSAPLRNYGLLPGDPRFVNSLWVQAKLSCWGVLFQVLFGMLLALLLNVPSRLVEFARTFFLIPMVLPPIVVAVIWKLIYTPDISPLYYAATSPAFHHAGTDIERRFRADRDHHRRHLGMAALHLPDGSRGAADHPG
ncbi:ABC-type sugar transport system permease subunit [Bradyrhizobium sp. LB9.1b]